jgi:hypothetical protein
MNETARALSHPDERKRVLKQAEARLSVLRNAPLDRWIALSSDETRIVAEGETFAGVVEAAERTDEHDPIVLRVPEDWTPRVLQASAIQL